MPLVLVLVVLRLLMDVHLHLLLLLLLLDALPPQLHLATPIIQVPRSKHRSLYLGACVVDIAQVMRA